MIFITKNQTIYKINVQEKRESLESCVPISAVFKYFVCSTF